MPRRYPRRLSFGALLRFAALLAVLFNSAGAAAGPLGLAEATVPANFTDSHVVNVNRPTAVAFTPDGRMLITSQNGQLWVYENGSLVTNPALDLASKICSNLERGLLGVAVDRDFADNHFIYLFYTFKKHGACPQYDPSHALNPVSRVSRFTLPATNVILTPTETVLIDNVTSLIGNHNGGDLQIDTDGWLYAAIGDGGGGGGQWSNTRSTGNLWGKVLRIGTDGSIPPDNPYTGADSDRCNVTGKTTTDRHCQEIFAYGLRNPFRFAFKPGTNQFHINDVGQGTWEEINLGAPGADYGWNVREGPCPYSNANCSPASNPNPAQYTAPIHYYGRGTGCYSITGGAFVPPGIWPAEYDNAYLFADFGCGKIMRLVGSGPGASHVDFATGLGANSLIELTFGPYGATQALYYTTYAGGTGSVRRIAYTGQANRPPTAVGAADPGYGPLDLEVTFSAAGSSDPDPGNTLAYDWNFGDGALITGTTSLTVTHTYTASGVFTATLFARDNRGAASTPVLLPIQPGNMPPSPAIVWVSPEQPFAVGDTLAWEATATDEDAIADEVTFAWEARLHHLDAGFPAHAHFHPYLEPTPGQAISLTAPAPEDFGATALSFLELRLTATDSWGLSTVVTQVVEPQRVPLEFVTDPPQLELLLADQAVLAPHTVTSWANAAFEVAAPLQTSPDGTAWLWQAWDDGALEATRTLTTPASAATYTASFGVTNEAPVPQVFHLEPASALVGAAPVTLTVTGKNFASDALILWAGAPLSPTTFISSTQLQVGLDTAHLGEVGVVAVSAANQGSGGVQAEEALLFTRWLQHWLPLILRKPA